MITCDSSTRLTRSRRRVLLGIEDVVVDSPRHLGDDVRQILERVRD